MTMKKFEMPKFEMIGLSKDLAFAGASDKGANVEFAIPKTTFKLGSGKFSRNALISQALSSDITGMNTSGLEDVSVPDAE